MFNFEICFEYNSHLLIIFLYFSFILFLDHIRYWELPKSPTITTHFIIKRIFKRITFCWKQRIPVTKDQWHARLSRDRDLTFIFLRRCCYKKASPLLPHRLSTPLPAPWMARAMSWTIQMVISYHRTK